MTNDESRDQDDELDPVLQRRFEELTAHPAPDIWALVQPESPVTPVANVLDPRSIADGDEVEVLVVQRVQNGSSSLLRAAAALVLLTGLGIWGLSLAGDSDEGQIEIAEGGEPTPSSIATVGESASCDAEQLQGRFHSGMALVDYDTTASFEDMVAKSDQRVFGSLVNAYGYDGGSVLTLDGLDVDQIWIPSRVAAGPLEGFVLAFLSDEIVGPAEGVRAVLPEGLWIACDPDEQALPGLAVPNEPDWLDTMESATLDELWSLAAETEQRASIELTFSDDDVAVYRISVADMQLRLSIPVAMAGDLASSGAPFASRPQAGLLRISGENFEIVVSLFDYCEGGDPSAVSLNSQGSWVQFLPGGVTVCRPMDSVKATISAVLSDADPDLFDLRFLDRAYSRSSEYGPDIPEAGPWLFPDSIVTRVANSALVGLDPVTLAETWRFESQSPLLWPTVKNSAFLVEEVNPSQLLQLDPLDGSLLWNIPLADDGPVQYLVDGWGGRVLRFARSDPLIPGQASAVENIDVRTGDILWRATGREGGIWSHELPIQTNSLIFAGEFSNDDQRSGNLTYAIDDATGEILWVLDFEIGDARWTAEGSFVSFIVTDDGIALIIRTVDRGVVRVDPRTGEILWSTVVQWGPIIGRQLAADGAAVGVAIRTPSGVVLLDAETGERLPN